MAKSKVTSTLFCALCGTPSVEYAHPICQVRAEKGLLPLKAAYSGCICCSSPDTRIIFDANGEEFEICGRCIGAK